MVHSKRAIWEKGNLTLTILILFSLRNGLLEHLTEQRQAWEQLINEDLQ
jgi:hypothetical protein